MKPARLIVGVSLALCLSSLVWHGLQTGPTERFDLTSLGPGEGFRLLVANREITIAIPAGEALSIGSFRLSDPDLDYDSGPIVRDGSLETVWIADVNADDQQDLITVARSAGSGGYTQVTLFLQTDAGYSVRTLPEISSKIVPGYMGHDDIRIHRDRIVVSFPTYLSSTDTRVDRQWVPADAIARKLPLKNRSDSNSDPSGKTRWLSYDFDTNRWKQ